MNYVPSMSFQYHKMHFINRSRITRTIIDNSSNVSHSAALARRELYIFALFTIPFADFAVVGHGLGAGGCKDRYYHDCGGAVSGFEDERGMEGEMLSAKERKGKREEAEGPPPS